MGWCLHTGRATGRLLAQIQSKGLAIKRIRLTTGMLDAMMAALSEMLAGEGPQTEDEAYNQKIMDDADRAASWVGQELNDREKQKQRK